MPHHIPRTRRPVTTLIGTAIAAVVALGLLVLPTATTTTVHAAGPANHDWLGIVNTYRAQSGLPSVSENAGWSAGDVSHSCWMLLNGIAHDEAPGTAGYTTAGDQAGNSGNVAVSSNPGATARSHIDLWMAGPFHAIGILRPTLKQAGFGICSSPPNPSATSWKSAATLDVLRGNAGGGAPSSPIVFPGNGATTPLTRFVAESPDPRSFCGWGGRDVGLPLIAMMPANVTSAVATITGPNGNVPTCVLHKANTTGTASAILGGDNAVVVVPNAPLARGVYQVSVGSNGGNAAWSFNVDPSAPLAVSTPAPENTHPLAGEARFESITPFRFADSRAGLVVGRLPENRQIRIKIAGQRGLPKDITAVSANFTVVNPDGRGFLTASNCSADRPTVSTLNYGPRDVVPNQAVISLDRGDICLFSLSGADIVIDINGYVGPQASMEFVPVNPKRLLDTRNSTALSAGKVRRLEVEGGSSPVPASATAVAVNLTGVGSTRNGWIRAYPCDRREPSVSSLNPRFTQSRANSAIVPIAADGTICLKSNIRTDVVVDVTGWLGPAGSLEFVPLESIRMADTRSLHEALNPSRVDRMLEPGRVLKVRIAGVRGVPANAKAASINLVSVGSWNRGWLRVTPCGTSSDVSNLNYSSPSAIANGANVKLDSSGSICVTTLAATHVIVDVTGVWT